MVCLGGKTRTSKIILFYGNFVMRSTKKYVFDIFFGSSKAKRTTRQGTKRGQRAIQGQPVQSSIHCSASQGRNGICLRLRCSADGASRLTGAAYCMGSDLLTGAGLETGSSLFRGQPVQSSIHRSASHGRNSIWRLSGRDVGSLFLSSGATAGVAPLAMMSFQFSAVV